MKRMTCLALALAALLAGCDDAVRPEPPCDVVPLTPGNWWRWAWADTVRSPVVMNSREYFPMRSHSFGLTTGGRYVYFRMDEACRLVVWNDGAEKVFIDFGAPVLEPWLLEFKESNGWVFTYQVQIISKRASSSYPRGSSDECYVVEIQALNLVDANFQLLIAPGIGVVRNRTSWGELLLRDYYVAGK